MTSLANQLEVMTQERDRLREALADIKGAIKFPALALSGANALAYHCEQGEVNGGIPLENLAMWLRAIAVEVDTITKILFTYGGKPTPTAAPASAGVGEEKKGEVQRERTEEADPSCEPDWTCTQCGTIGKVKQVTTESLDGTEYDLECLVCECQEIAESPIEALSDMGRRMEDLELKLEAELDKNLELRADVQELRAQLSQRANVKKEELEWMLKIVHAASYTWNVETYEQYVTIRAKNPTPSPSQSEATTK